MICIAALPILGCSETSGEVCAGWRPVFIADATARYMAESDPQALAGLIAHHAFGAEMNCW